MKKIMAIIALAAMIYACGGGSSSTESQSSTDVSATAEATPKPNGEKIYKQYCVACHGLYGDMGASGAYDLTSSELPVEERITVITNGRNTMTAFEAILEEEEIAAVANYTLTLKAKD